MRVRVCASEHQQIHTNAITRTRTHTLTLTHARTHTLAHTRTHTLTHTHARTHSHICRDYPPFWTHEEWCEGFLKLLDQLRLDQVHLFGVRAVVLFQSVCIIESTTQAAEMHSKMWQVRTLGRGFRAVDCDCNFLSCLLSILIIAEHTKTF